MIKVNTFCVRRKYVTAINRESIWGTLQKALMYDRNMYDGYMKRLGKSLLMVQKKMDFN